MNNVIHQYAVINRIFLEHTRELGTTLEEIAEDKSYVITENMKCVYISKQNAEVMDVLENRAKKYNITIKKYGKDFWAENIRYLKNGMSFNVVVNGKRYSDIIEPLMGIHQAENCALAIAFLFRYY